jgi:hypothetical protein
MSESLKRATSASWVFSESKATAVRAYCRCNSGHYFQGEHCPFDGWSSPASRELTKAVRKLASDDCKLSLAALCQLGLSDATLERVVVIDFGCEASAFDALAPQEYVINGKSQTFPKVDAALK